MKLHCAGCSAEIEIAVDPLGPLPEVRCAECRATRSAVAIAGGVRPYVEINEDADGFIAGVEVDLD